MDAITLIITLFLNLAPGCDAQPAREVQINKIEYRVLTWQCIHGQTYQAWYKRCPNGLYSLPFYLEETTSKRGFYTNRFGETVAAGSNIENVDAYTYCPA